MVLQSRLPGFRVSAFVATALVVTVSGAQPHDPSSGEPPPVVDPPSLAAEEDREGGAREDAPPAPAGDAPPRESNRAGRPGDALPDSEPRHAAGPGRTQPAKESEAEATDPGSSDEIKKPKWVLATEGKFGRFRIKGRVFVRGVLQNEEREVVGADGSLEQARVTSFDLFIRSARFGVKYRAPAKWLRAEVEVEARSGNARGRDAYIEAKGRELSAKAGNFKVPVSIIELDSAWDLPVAERHQIREILRGWLDVAGRRPGVTASYHPKIKPKPSLVLGVFQGSELVGLDPGDRDTDPLWKTDRFAQSLAARAELDLGSLEFGAFYEHRVGSPALLETDHYWTGGADAVLDLDTTGGGLRVWLDAMAGASWYEHSGKAEDDADATFLLSRLIVGYRFGGTEDEAPYIEPFLMAGVFEPDTQVTADLLTELALGLNVGLWDRARVALQGEWSQVGKNWPDGLATAVAPKRLAALLQASVVF